MYQAVSVAELGSFPPEQDPNSLEWLLANVDVATGVDFIQQSSVGSLIGAPKLLEVIDTSPAEMNSGLYHLSGHYKRFFRNAASDSGARKWRGNMRHGDMAGVISDVSMARLISQETEGSSIPPFFIGSVAVARHIQTTGSSRSFRS